MPVQVWDNAEDNFLGRLDEHRDLTVELTLSEAGRFNVSAPYRDWRELMEITPNFQHVRLYGAGGTELMRGNWLTRDDNPGVPGMMDMAGVDLLEELREPCLPPDFYISHYPVIDGITWLLTESGTDWVIGDTTLAATGFVSVNLGGESYLSAILELAELSGNYVRHDGVTRSLDIFATPFPVIARAVAIEASDEDLNDAVGRIVPPLSLTIDTGEVLQGVYPRGGSVIDKDGNEAALRPTGNEDLPAGYSFSRLRGHVAIINDSVTQGLFRVAEYSLIEPLSNRSVTASGDVEASGNGWIQCEALRRPNNQFWRGAIVTIAETEYEIAMHTGATITGSWGTVAVGIPFSVERVFEYDADAEDESRQDLVDAAVGFLAANAAASEQLTVVLQGLRNTRIRPGDQVRLEWVATVEAQNLITDELDRYLMQSFRGNLVVGAVEAQVGTETLYRLDLAKNLQLIPTDSGLREMEGFIQSTRRHADNRIMVTERSTAPLATWPGMLWMDEST